MLKITHLEGYAGLRLKNNQPIEIKKGINLAIGKNGSGKSNLATLAKFIFNESQQPNKKLIESTFIDDLVTKTIARYRERKTASEQNNRAVNGNIQRVDFEHKIVCKFLFEEVAGSISFKLNQEVSLETFADFMKRMNFSNQYIFMEPVQRLLTIDILAQIGLNNEEILINKDIRLFQSSGQNSQNPIVSSIVTSFNTFFERRWQQFNENDTQLQSEFSRLKDEILFQYSNFFVQVNKEIHITLDPTEYEGKALVLKENGNIITFESLSDGEKNLFNLIINISLARTNKPAFIHLDEPELFMHDDMIKTLVKEIRTLSSELPDTCVFISTHSSVFIELLAELGEDELNLITIVDKMVSNSKNDIEFINVLNNNGVVFSPLYISKKPNLFIENNSEDGRNHREFYSRFFNKETKPNIIPIGS